MVNKGKKAQRKKLKKGFKNSILFVLVLVFFIGYVYSPLNNVSEIKVAGNKNVTEKDILELSEISEQTRFWPHDFNKNSKLLKRNKMIKTVTIKRKFPNKVVVKVEEHDKVAYLLEGKKLFPVLSNGSVIRVSSSVSVSDLPILVNWKEGKELEKISNELLHVSADAKNLISEIHYSPNEINPLRIAVFMTDGIEINGTITGFAKKIDAYPSIATKIPPDVEGIIDMEVGYVLKPFKSESDSPEKSKVSVQ